MPDQCTLFTQDMHSQEGGLMKRVAAWAVASIVAIGLGAVSAMAEPAMIKQAQDAGLPAELPVLPR
jgi:hypothetical protein